MKLDYLLILHKRINSKRIKDFNVRPKNINILEESMSNYISDIAHSNFLSDIPPQAREEKENK